jgi:hypothetical protein
MTEEIRVRISVTKHYDEWMTVPDGTTEEEAKKLATAEYQKGEWDVTEESDFWIEVSEVVECVDPEGRGQIPKGQIPLQ